MAESNPYLKPEILARITKLGLRAQRVVEGTISGLHRSPLHGLSVEFADYREYAPGDDLKRLDWRAYARTNRHFIKQYEEESNLRATLLVDASASMNYGRGAMSKFNYAATIAASIAHLCVKQRDAVGMAIFDNAERVWLRPVATHAQLMKILDLLERTRPERTTELGQVMAKVCDQIRSRGMVIVISDLLCDLDSFYKSLGRLQHQGHEILIMQVLDREEIELPFNDSVLFKDIEGEEQLFAEPWAFRKAYKKAMETFIEEVAQRCRFCGIDHVLLTTDEDLSLSLSHYLHQRQRSDHGKRGEDVELWRVIFHHGDHGGHGERIIGALNGGIKASNVTSEVADTSCVATAKMFVRTAKMFVPTEKILVRTTESFVRTEKILVRTSKSFVRTEKVLVRTTNVSVRTTNVSVRTTKMFDARKFADEREFYRDGLARSRTTDLIGREEARLRGFNNPMMHESNSPQR